MPVLASRYDRPDRSWLLLAKIWLLSRGTFCVCKSFEWWWPSLLLYVPSSIGSCEVKPPYMCFHSNEHGNFYEAKNVDIARGKRRRLRSKFKKRYKSPSSRHTHSIRICLPSSYGTGREVFEHPNAIYLPCVVRIENLHGSCSRSRVRKLPFDWPTTATTISRAIGRSWILRKQNGRR